MTRLAGAHRTPPLLLRALAALALALPCGAARAQFTDLSESADPDAVRFLAEEGTLAGFPDDTFRPAAGVRRADLVAVVTRALGLADEATGGCFTDVPEGAWFAPSVCAAAGRGLVTGFGDGSFRPLEPVSYAQALKVVLDAFDPPRGGAASGLPPDAAWYLPYQLWADTRGYLGLQAYAADGALSRDALASLLYAVLAPAARSTQRSAGCGAPPPAAPATAFAVRGAERSVIAHVPDTYRVDVPAPLIVAFHGRTSPAAQVRRYYRLEAAFPDAVVVYPRGVPDEGGFTWSEPGDASDALRDYALFDLVLARYAADYCLDLGRVLVAGHSLGGWFAASLACARGDEIRALLSVGGGVSPSSCAAPVAALVVHNPDDRLVPFAQGEATRDLFLALDGVATRAPEPATEPPLASLRCVWYDRGGVQPVAWCPHDRDRDASGRDYPHQWPRGAAEAFAAFVAALP